MQSTLRKESVVFDCRKTKRSGFTLAEILVVLAAIICLAAGAVVVGKNYLESGRYNAAVSQYKFEMEEYPDSLNTLTQKVEQYGPWLSADSLQDPWDNDYQYSFNEADNRFAVWSNGPDGTNSSGNNPAEFTGDDIGVLGH